MKRIMYTLFVFLLMIPWANATIISTSASGTSFGDDYSYLFEIEDDVSDATIFHATLTNTSPHTSDALIDRFYFNMVNNGYTVNFTVNTAGWTVGLSSGGVLFDYAGGSTQEARLAYDESMTFDMEITGSIPVNPFDLWTLSETTNGAGAAGGDDYGQVAVRFQQLGDDGNDSDLLASYWAPVPEPASILLLGVGLVGFASSFRRRKQ